jgi:hypothetical protein
VIKQARALARAQAAQIPNAVVYAIVLDQLNDVDAALGVGAMEALESARPLGVLAVRELEDAEADAAELRRLLLQIRDGLRTLAGLPYYA